MVSPVISYSRAAVTAARCGLNPPSCIVWLNESANIQVLALVTSASSSGSVGRIMLCIFTIRALCFRVLNASQLVFKFASTPLSWHFLCLRFRSCIRSARVRSPCVCMILDHHSRPSTSDSQAHKSSSRLRLSVKHPKRFAVLLDLLDSVFRLDSALPFAIQIRLVTPRLPLVRRLRLANTPPVSR